MSPSLLCKFLYVLNLKYQSTQWNSAQTDIDYLHETTQSGPDSQTAPPQALNTWRSCNAAPSHGQRTGFAGGSAGTRYPLPWFPLSDDLYGSVGFRTDHSFKDKANLRPHHNFHLRFY